jgi:Bacteriophage baseplate protein W
LSPQTAQSTTSPAPDPAKAFLGIGWAFPLALDAGADFELAIYEEDIRQSILIILGTDPGERVMRPTFGAGLSSFLFAPMNATTYSRVRLQVQEALVDWEPRIIVQDVTVTPDPVETRVLNISATYQVRATNTVQNLVFPFYLDDQGAGTS